MKKVLAVLFIALLITGIMSCKSREQQMYEAAMEQFEDMTGQEQYSEDNYDYEYDEDDYDMEPNEDGLDVENEVAGVGATDNYGREGEIYIEDGENSIQLGGADWPDDAPGVVPEPKFADGEITGVIGSPAGTAVSYMNVTMAEAAALIESYMGDSSWTTIMHTQDSDWVSYSGQNGDIFLTIDWDCGEFAIIWEYFG